jgi:tRNA(His) 5'-end guanylyltransferase
MELMKTDAARQEPLLSVIGSILEESIMRNHAIQEDSSLPSFTGRRPPITPSAFVTRYFAEFSRLC